MLTIALVGADGAGKSTVVAQLPAALGRPVRTMYMGVNPAAATHPLPTTSLVRWARRVAGRERHSGGPPPVRSTAPDAATATTTTAITNPPPRSRPTLAAAVGDARGLLRTTNRIAEESYQRAVCRWHLDHGRLVLFDRYYRADYHAHDLAGGDGLSLAKRLHGAYLRRWCPDPDLVIVLDAPADVLHARKREGTVEELASRRAEYLTYARTAPRAVIVDASRSLEQVMATVVAAITRAIDDLDPGPAHDGELAEVTP